MAATLTQYNEIFARECVRVYPVMDELEHKLGAAIKRDKLRNMARVLACPHKVNPPNWQHGRLIYSVARWYMAPRYKEDFNFLDIGTAKGFSALCMQNALIDSYQSGLVTSLDVIDPDARVSRNSVAETDGLKTLAEILSPWPESKRIQFYGQNSLDWLVWRQARIHFAFIDGKHRYDYVKSELNELARLQSADDIIIVDDTQIESVHKAVQHSLREYRVLHQIALMPQRHYMVMERR